MSNEPHCRADALRATWNKCVQQHASAFLHRVLGPNTPLSDVVAALQFLADQGVPYEDLCLRDVLGTVPTDIRRTQNRRKQRAPCWSEQLSFTSYDATESVPAPSNATSVPLSATPAPAAVRTPEATERLKSFLVRTLVGTLEPQTTSDLLQALRRAGEDAPMPEVERLLAVLQADGRIKRHPQKTRAWMFRPQNRTQAQSFTIKKAETPQAPAAGIPRLPATLTSPYERSYDSSATPEPVSAQMQALGKPATDSERERLQGMLLMAARLRGLHLQRGNEGEDKADGSTSHGNPRLN